MAINTLPIQFERNYKGASEIGRLFTSTAALNAWLTNPTRYAGQPATLVEGGVVTEYRLNATEDAWEELSGGGGGGLNKWAVSTAYVIDDVIWEETTEKIYVAIADHTSDAADFTNDLANWKELSDKSEQAKRLAYSLSTGLISGCEITPGVTPGTIDIAPGKGIRVDNTTDPENPSIIVFDIAARTNQVLPNIATQPVTYVLVNALDNLALLSAFPSDGLRRDNVFLGIAVHTDNATINAINNIPDFVMSPGAQLYDLMRGLGTFNLEGNIVSANGANLSLNVSSGKIFKAGVNVQTNPKIPNSLTLAGQTLATFRYRLQDSTELADVTVLDPTQYDNGGVLTVVPNNNNATIQRVYIFPSGAVRIQPGQEVFTTIAQAVDAVGKESFVTEDNIKENGLLLASIVIRKVATDLTNPADAQIFLASRFGELGSVGSKFAAIFQDVYENSSVPQIVLDAIRGGLVISDNAVPIVGNLFAITDDVQSKKHIEVSADRTAVEDRDERHVLRKESNATYIEDFKENNPTDVITGLGSWTVSSATIASEKLRGYQSAKLTQVAGSLGATREIVGIPLTNEEIGSEMGLVFPFRYDGDANDIKVEILQSDDGVTYDVVGEINGALTLPRSLETSYAKLNGQFRSSAVFKGFRFTVLTENIGAELIFDNVRFITNPMPTAEFVQTELVEAEKTGTTTYAPTDTQITGISPVLDDSSMLSSDIVTAGFTGNYTIEGYFEAKTFDASMRLMYNVNGGALKNLTLASGVGTESLADGRSGFSTEKLNKNDELRFFIRTNISRDVDYIKIKVTATRNSTNVIFKGAPNSELDFNEYNPTLNGWTSVSGVSVFKRRVGDCLEIQGRFTGTGAAVEAQIGLPSALTVSASKVPITRLVGTLTLDGTSDADYNILATGGDSFLNIGLQSPSSTGALTPQTGSSVYASNRAISFYALVPIEGWTADAPLLSVPLNDVVAPTIKETISTDVTTDTVFKTITGLEIGKTYYYKPSFNMLIGSGDGTVEVVMRRPSGGTIIKPLRTGNGGGSAANETLTCCFEFTAQDTSVEFQTSSFGAGTTLYAADTVIQIEEKKNEGIFSVNAPLSNGQSNATPYWTGRMLDGRKVMVATVRATGTYTDPTAGGAGTTHTLGTIGTSLDILKTEITYKFSPFGGKWTSGNFSEAGTSTEVVTHDYDPTNGNMNVYVRSSAWTITDPVFEVLYLQ